MARGAVSDLTDAAHFGFGIGHPVPALARAFGRGADGLFTKINIAVKLAHDQQVHRPSDLVLERREVFEARKNLGGAQVGKQLQLFAQTQDRLLGAKGTLQSVAIGIAHRAKQDGVRLARGLKRFGR